MLKKWRDRTGIDSELWLLFALIMLLVLPLIMTIFPNTGSVLLVVSYSSLVLIGIKTVAEKKRTKIIGMILGGTSLLLIWAVFFDSGNHDLIWLSKIGLLLFFGFLAFFIFSKIANNKRVNMGIISNSISGYLLIGLIGGLFFQLLEFFMAGSFTPLNPNNGLYDLHYLGFVTLTTLGYGDIAPRTEAAQSLTILVCITGQLYLTILVAMLVGKYLSHPKNNSIYE